MVEGGRTVLVMECNFTKYGKTILKENTCMKKYIYVIYKKSSEMYPKEMVKRLDYQLKQI